MRSEELAPEQRLLRQSKQIDGGQKSSELCGESEAAQ